MRMKSGAATIGNEFIAPAIFCGSVPTGMPVIQTKTGVGSAIDVYSGIQSLLIRVSTNIKGLGVTKNRSSPFNVA